MAAVRGRILVVDDEEHWRNTVQRVLVAAGYDVVTVEEPKKAQERLRSESFHLAILDIRMVDDDPENVAGMTLVEALNDLGLASAVKVVMLSAYGTKEQMRKAFARYDVADFVDKQKFDNREFRTLVDDVFREDVRVNLDLKVSWRGSTARDALVGVFVDDVDGAGRVRKGTPAQERLADELDDLLRRLFVDATSLIVTPIAPGHSGAGVLRVQPFFPDGGGGNPVVVKFGDRATIETEQAHFEKHVKHFLGGARATSLQTWRRTRALGGIVYSLLGAPREEMPDFASMYATAEPKRIGAILDGLFHGTCANWYAPKVFQPLNLTEDYLGLLRIGPEDVVNAFGRMKTVAGKERLRFDGLTGDTKPLNPIPGLLEQDHVYPTYACVTHGDLNALNIFVDGDDHTWLIDFFRTGRGHILRDLAELDTVVRFLLLGPDEATLDERLALEEALLAPRTFAEAAALSGTWEGANAAVTKAFETSAALRRIAASLVAANPNADLAEYHVAQAFFALNLIRFKNPDVQRDHALLAAALLHERLLGKR